MTETYVLDFVQSALTVGLMLAAPVLLVSLGIGILVSIFQAITSINEVTLTFVPKMIGIILVLLLLGSWMIQQMLAFTTDIFVNLPNMPR